MKKRIFGVLLTICMILTLLPATAMTVKAEAKVTTATNVIIAGVELNSTNQYYHNGEGGAAGTADAEPDGANASFKADTGTLTLNGLDVKTSGTHGISCVTGNLTIILPEGTTNNIDATNAYAISTYAYAISASYNLTLAITGEGSLNATNTCTAEYSSQGYSTIQSNSITISGGAKVTATSKEYSAYAIHADVIAIKDRNTVVKAFDNGAAIGAIYNLTVDAATVESTSESGYALTSGFDTKIGNCTISNGAKVTVKSTSETAMTATGTLKISDSTVDATSNGRYKSAICGSAGEITISGGTVTAKNTNESEGGPAIVGKSLTVTGGTVNAESKNHVAIGSFNITISGGTVNAESTNGFAIGDIWNNVTMNISGGTVNAKSENGMAIGQRDINNSITMNISGGTVNAESTNNFAIGETTSNHITTTISGGTVTATGKTAFQKEPTLNNSPMVTVGTVSPGESWNNSTDLISYPYVKIGYPVMSVDFTGKDETPTKYDDFSTGWNAAVSDALNTSGTTVKLLTDWTATGNGTNNSFGTGIGFGGGGTTTSTGYIRVPSGKNIILDLNGKTIDRALTEGIGDKDGKDDSTAGWVIGDYGTLTLKDSSSSEVEKQGKITGGWNSYPTFSAGGVFVSQECSFMMEGGNITGNQAINWGGGVYVSQKAQFTMTGGKISENFANYDGANGGGGGGVYVGATFDTKIIVGGTAVIKDNYLNSTSYIDNVYLPELRIISCDKDTPLTTGASIGVTTSIKPAKNAPVAITGSNSADYSQYFLSDNADYTVLNSVEGDNQIVRLVKYNIVKYDTNGGTPANIEAKTGVEDSQSALLPTEPTEPTKPIEPTRAGYDFKYWKVTPGGTETGVKSTDTYSSLAGDATSITLQAQWTEKANVTLTYTAGSNGTVSSTSETIAPATGTAAGSTATANPGYHFVNWTNNIDVTTTADPTLTQTQVDAVAKKSGAYEAAIFTANFAADVIVPTAITPIFTPGSGTYTSAQTVTITSETEGADIYYTTDGTTPTVSSTKYTGAITVGKDMTLQAFAVKDGYYASSFGAAEYKITVKDIAGETRYDTMNEIVDLQDVSTGSIVIVATGENYPDALAASGLAGCEDVTILLTDGGKLSAQTAEQITKIAPSKVMVIGGESAVSEDVKQEIESLVPASSEVTRIGGTDRLDTAVKIYGDGKDEMSKQCIITTGGNFADALSIAPYAYAAKCPIFLTKEDGTLDEASVAAIKAGGFTSAVIAGGTAVVSDAVIGQTGLGSENIVRLGKDNRYLTSSCFADWATGKTDEAVQPLVQLTCEKVCVASGENFPDALAGASLAGKNLAPMLLVTDGDLGEIVIDANLKPNADQIGNCYILGGTDAISQAVRDKIAGVL